MHFFVSGWFVCTSNSAAAQWAVKTAVNEPMYTVYERRCYAGIACSCFNFMYDCHVLGYAP